MIIEKSSPLLGLPANLGSRQTLFLEGIRFSFQMADLAYDQLSNSIYSLTILKQGRDNQGFILTTAAFLNAWSFVDSINRLRDLLQQMPKLKKKSIEWFYKETKSISDLRNSVQHLNNEYNKMVDENAPPWGSLNWFFFVDKKLMKGSSCLLVSGSLKPKKNHQIFNPAGKVFRNELDHIILRFRDIESNLSDVYFNTVNLAKGLENSIAPQIVGHSHSGADWLVMVEMEFQ